MEGKQMKKKITKIEDNYFVKVNKELIKGDLDIKVGDIFGLEVSEVGEQIVFQLKRIENSTKDAEETKFSECFKQNWDGSLKTVRTLQIGGIKMQHPTKIGKGILFGGIDMQLFIGRNLSVIKQPDYWTIVGIY
jgi:hypothetical protein